MATKTNVPQLTQQSNLAVIPEGHQPINALARFCGSEVVQTPLYPESVRAARHEAIERPL